MHPGVLCYPEWRGLVMKLEATDPLLTGVRQFTPLTHTAAAPPGAGPCPPRPPGESSGSALATFGFGSAGDGFLPSSCT